MQVLFEDVLPLIILHTMVAVALVFLLRTLARRFPEEHFLNYWGWAWAAYAGYLLFGGASVQLSRLRLLSEALALASMLPGFVQAPLVMLGADLARHPIAATKRRGHWTIAFAVALALLVFFLSMLQSGDRIPLRMAPRQILAGMAFFYCAAAFHQRAKSKGSRSALVLTSACAAYGIVYLFEAAAIALMVQTPRLQPLLFLIYVDLVCQFAIAAGMILLLDDEYQLQHRRLSESEEQLRQAQKMEAVGQLAGGVAHDFNNLLTLIRGHAEALGATPGLVDQQQKHLEEINRTSEQASALIRQLLAFSRKQVLQPKVLQLNSVVGQIAPMLQGLVGEQVELEIVADPQPGRVKADRSQMEQVLMNLAVNSRDAMPKGGRLSIRTENVEIRPDQPTLQGDVQPPVGHYVLLQVRDTGVGMDRSTQAHIFEPFFTTKEPTKGTGLGLATVYGIVKQSGGWIGVESELGRGTTFRIYLPQVEELVDAVETAEPIAASSPPLSGGATILLVEDEKGIRELAGKFLTNNGYTVLAAGNGAEALDLAEHYPRPVDLLVTDMVMPKLGGKELVRQLTQSIPRMKVLFISGYSKQGGRDTGLEEAAGYLPKPFSMEQLVRKVREVLDRPS
ncbi:MAG TPA: ATP-binding protein [Myxococcaceae bacterium]|nr:ATP-binding protein [Myxococcaceae bacterium]